VNVPIASPVYTLGAWQGNVRDDFGVEWIVEGEDGWSSSPPVRALIEDKVAGDGSWSGPGAYAARVIGLTGKALASDRVSMLQAKERIKAVGSPRALSTLQVDEAHLSRMALVRQSDQIAITDYGAFGFQWSLILVAPDPRRYSVDVTSGATGLPSTITTGRTYTETFPILYGGGGVAASGSVLFTQYGNYDQTPATIVFSGPVVTPQVAHVQTGRSLTFDLELRQGETLTVDLGGQAVLLNGSASRVSSLTPGSAWFSLVPGPNELQFRGQAGSSPDGTTPLMTVTAASAWT
jgi:hypothetical protein